MKDLNHARCGGAIVGGVMGMMACDFVFDEHLLGSGYAVALVVVLSIVAAVVAGRVHGLSREVQLMAGAVLFGSLGLSLCGSTLYVLLMLVRAWGFLAEGLSIAWMLALAAVPLFGFGSSAWLLHECGRSIANLRHEKSPKTS